MTCPLQPIMFHTRKNSFSRYFASERQNSHRRYFASED